MGYRSNVGYTIRFTDVGTMTLFLEEAKSKGLHVALDECDIVQNKQLDKYQINFYNEGVKWYESYDEVKAHTDLLELVQDWCATARERHIRETGEPMPHDAYPLGFIFVRVGEDTSDIEEDCGGDYDWGWLRAERRVVGDWM